MVPFGVGNTRQLLQTIVDLKITAISCTPSYPSLLDKVLRTANRQPRDLGLSLGLFGGDKPRAVWAAVALAAGAAAGAGGAAARALATDKDSNRTLEMRINAGIGGI